MNVRRYVFGAAPIWLILFIGMLLYVLAYVEPATTGRNWWYLCVTRQSSKCTDFLPDTVAYLDQSIGFSIDDIALSKASLTPLKQVFLYWQAEAARQISRHYQYTVIFVMNFVVYLATIALLCATLDRLEIEFPVIGFALLAFNPYVLLLVLTLNKDLWCFLAVAAGAYAASRRSLLLLALSAGLAIVVRDIFAVMIVAAYIVSRERIGLKTFLVLGSFGLNVMAFIPGMADKIALRDALPSLLGLHTAWFWHHMDWIQENVPAGQLIVFPVTFAINVAADAISVSDWREIVSAWPIIYLATVGSSMLFTTVTIAFVVSRNRWVGGRRLILKQAVVYAFMISIYPILHHRYYLPVYLLAVPAVFGRPAVQRRGKAHRSTTMTNAAPNGDTVQSPI